MIRKLRQRHHLCGSSLEDGDSEKESGHPSDRMTIMMVLMRQVKKGTDKMKLRKKKNKLETSKKEKMWEQVKE